MALRELWADNASTTLANAITPLTGTISVAPGTANEFPPIVEGVSYFRIVLTPSATPNSRIEVCIVYKVVGDTLSVIRGVEGTTAQAWALGDLCFNAFSKGGVENFAQASLVQSNFYISGKDTGVANAYVFVPDFPIENTPQLFQEIAFEPTHTNTGSATVQIGSVYPILGMGGLPLQGGEIVAGDPCRMMFNGSSFVLEYSQGGKVQVPDATQSHQAVSLGQVPAIKVNEAGTADYATTAGYANSAGGFAGIPAGTKMLFAQASAPPGWSQVTSDMANNRMMVLTSAGNGGAIGGSASPIVMSVVPAHTHNFTSNVESVGHTHTGSGTTAPTNIDHNHTGTTGQMSTNASHSHGFSYNNAAFHSQVFYQGGLTAWAFNVDKTENTNTAAASTQHTHDFTTSNIASGSNVPSHTHTFSVTTGTESAQHTHSGTTDNGSSPTNWQPRYTYIIICEKS